MCCCYELTAQNHDADDRHFEQVSHRPARADAVPRQHEIVLHRHAVDLVAVWTPANSEAQRADQRAAEAAREPTEERGYAARLNSDGVQA